MLKKIASYSAEEPFDPDPLLASVVVIDTACALKEFLSLALSGDILAVDTESAAFYRYNATVNLIQVATRERAALIDPQILKDLGPLREFAENSRIEWIFHGGSYDAAILSREFGVNVKRLFDTQVAADLLGKKELGLSSLAAAHLGFPLDKKLQRCDWSRRPMTDAMKKYAILDAICLVPLRDILQEELLKTDRYDWAREEFEVLAAECRNVAKPLPRQDAFMIKGALSLPGKSLGILREVWNLRESIARKFDRAPFMILSNRALMEIALQAPRTLTGLSVVSSVPRSFLEKFGQELLIAVKTGMESDLSHLKTPKQKRSSSFSLTAQEGEGLKIIREERSRLASKYGIPPSSLVSPKALTMLVHLKPDTMDAMYAVPDLRRWQVKIISESMLPLIRKIERPTASGRRRSRRGRKRPS